MKTVAIISMAKYPVPAVKGGAVETLVTTLLDANEKEPKYKFLVITFQDEEARLASSRYKHSQFFFVQKTVVGGVMNKIIQFTNKLFKRNDSYYYQMIRQILQKNPVDLLLLEACSTYAPLLKRDFKEIPLLHHFHNIPTEDAAKRFRLDNFSEGYLCISRFIVQKTIENLGAKENKTHVLYNCVNTDVFCPNSKSDDRNKIRKELGFSTRDFVIIYAGRLQPYKGIKELLQGFNALEDEHIKLMIVGDSFFAGSKQTPFIAELQMLAQKNKDRIVFTGFIPYAEICKYYQASDIAVLPSIWDEPFGLTCLEAISTGLPVIITKSGGMQEIIDEQCGIMVERGQELPSLLASHITEIYKDKGMQQRMSVCARERAQMFDIRHYWNNFQVIINSYL